MSLWYCDYPGAYMMPMEKITNVCVCLSQDILRYTKPYSIVVLLQLYRSTLYVWDTKDLKAGDSKNSPKLFLPSKFLGWPIHGKIGMQNILSYL